MVNSISQVLKLNFLTECDCREEGSRGCNDKGECLCKTRVNGKKCNKCKDGYYGFPNCEGK